MKRILRHLLVVLLPLLASAASRAAPQHFEIDTDLPPVVENSTKPRQCTIAYMMEDITNNDMFVARMQISPTPNATATRGRLPCPTSETPRLGDRALDSCRERAADPRTCVFADMSRGFSSDPLSRNSSQGGSQCASDLASQIAVACWNAGKYDVCNVACGNTPEEATLAARNRCEGKHERPCTISGSIPVLAP